jgi:hypothetical protein
MTAIKKNIVKMNMYLGINAALNLYQDLKDLRDLKDLKGASRNK